nr:integrase, catalytic region, zinc finger, CCHC-type, peptidase aspartic, catalytic [Tanacetum cinerariifolium]
MTGDRSQLANFVHKFLGTVKFGNDHDAKIMGYGDYKIENVTISRVYFVEGLGHNLFYVGQFCDSDLKASKTKSWLWHRRLSHLNFGAINHLARQGLVRGLPKLKFKKDHLCSARAMGKQNGVVKRRNCTLIEAARTMLIYAQAPLFLWAEAVATACYTQNRSIVRLRHGKTPYELLHNKLPDLSFLYVFGALCYPTHDSENLRKLQLKADIGIFIGSGLVPKPTSLTPYVPPSRNDWDLLFQPLYDELLTPPSSVDPPAPEVIAPLADVIPFKQAESTGSSSSTTVNQDAHSPRNDPLFGMPIPEVASDQSSSMGCYKVDISHETSVDRSLQQNGVVERRNHMLIEAAYTIENLGKLQSKADIRIFNDYAPIKKAFRIYNRHTRHIVETIHVSFDELTAMASEQSSLGNTLHKMTPTTISSGLVPKPTCSTLFVPSSRNDWDFLFQPLFDELLTPPPSVDTPAPEVIALIDEVVAPELAKSTSSPSSTTVDQDVPSPSKSQTTPETQPPVIPQDVEEDNHDIEVAYMGNDPLFGIPILDVASDQYSSTVLSHTIMDPDHQISQHTSK